MERSVIRRTTTLVTPRDGRRECEQSGLDRRNEYIEFGKEAQRGRNARSENNSIARRERQATDWCAKIRQVSDVLDMLAVALMVRRPRSRPSVIDT